MVRAKAEVMERTTFSRCFEYGPCTEFLRLV